MKINQATVDLVKRLWDQRREDLETAAEARRENNEVLKEIRGDIKIILIRLGGEKT